MCLRWLLKCCCRERDELFLVHVPENQAAIIARPTPKKGTDARKRGGNRRSSPTNADGRRRKRRTTGRDERFEFRCDLMMASQTDENSPPKSSGISSVPSIPAVNPETWSAVQGGQHHGAGSTDTVGSLEKMSRPVSEMIQVPPQISETIEVIEVERHESPQHPSQVDPAPPIQNLQLSLPEGGGGQYETKLQATPQRTKTPQSAPSSTPSRADNYIRPVPGVGSIAQPYVRPLPGRILPPKTPDFTNPFARKIHTDSDSDATQQEASPAPHDSWESFSDQQSPRTTYILPTKDTEEEADASVPPTAVALQVQPVSVAGTSRVSSAPPTPRMPSLKPATSSTNSPQMAYAESVAQSGNSKRTRKPGSRRRARRDPPISYGSEVSHATHQGYLGNVPPQAPIAPTQYQSHWNTPPQSTADQQFNFPAPPVQIVQVSTDSSHQSGSSSDSNSESQRRESQSTDASSTPQFSVANIADLGRAALERKKKAKQAAQPIPINITITTRNKVSRSGSRRSSPRGNDGKIMVYDSEPERRKQTSSRDSPPRKAYSTVSGGSRASGSPGRYRHHSDDDVPPMPPAPRPAPVLPVPKFSYDESV